MDSGQFDGIARSLAGLATRRRVVGALMGLVAGAGAVAGAEAGDPRRSYCRPLAANCTRNSQCCSGACDTNRKTHRTRRNRCICVPDCDGKVCGSDGCGGTCGPYDGACEFDYETCNAGACEHPCYEVNAGCYELLDGTIRRSPDGCATYTVWYDPDPCFSDAECVPGSIFGEQPGEEIICARRQFQSGMFVFGTNSNAIEGGTCVSYAFEQSACI
jgi:hypothetical protein